MSVMVPLGVVYEIRWVFSQKKLSFCQLLYGRKCQRRGQALGQKKDKILSTPTNLFFALELLIDSKFQVSHFSGLEKILMQPKFKVFNSRNKFFGIIMVHGFYKGFYLKSVLPIHCFVVSFKKFKQMVHRNPCFIAS